MFSASSTQSKQRCPTSSKRHSREGIEKTIGIPQLEIVEQIVETPETQTIQGARTSEKSGTAPVRHATQTEIVEVVEIEASIPEEELHGVGGFVFDAHGNRVANELGGRNCVTGEMWKNKPPFSLDLNKATSDDIAWQCKHYTGRGVRKHHESGTALVEDMEAPSRRSP